MELATPRLLLREFLTSDAEATHAYERDPGVMRFMRDGARTQEESLAAVQESIALAAEQPRHIWDLALCRDGLLIGRAGFARDLSESQDDVRLWYILHPAHQGQGYVTEAIRALLGFAFDELGVHRAVIDVDPRNVASARVPERLGFRREAHLVQNYRVRDAWTDSVLYALLEDEWRALKAAGRAG